MTLWLKKLRLYLLRRNVKATTRRLIKTDATTTPFTFVVLMDYRADLIDRIAEIEKSL